jgi:hypothetical protein
MFSILVCDAQQYEARANEQALARESDTLDDGDSDIITRYDKPGYQKQFDAFLLYADEDYDFAQEVISQLEDSNKYCIEVSAMHLNIYWKRN